VLAASVVSLGLTISAAQADAVKVSPYLTVFTKERTVSNDGQPTVLRGSATRRGTVHYDKDRYPAIPIDVGSTLWLADPVTGEFIACEPSYAGHSDDRYVDCFDVEEPN
ncbi:MAG: hypothetical protein ACR2QF_00500, partial [Geminicoccaceae bacterium]